MGVDIEHIEEGTGPKPTAGQTIAVHYRGTLTDGSEFDSSHKRGKPLEFKVGTGQVIKGWDEGMLEIKLGGKAKLTISADYAYGASGIPGVIPPSATLIFEVELMNIK